MNQKTAKLIRNYCAAQKVNLTAQRQLWHDTPALKRGELRAHMQGVVTAAKEKARHSLADELERKLAKEPVCELEEQDIRQRISALREPYRT